MLRPVITDSGNKIVDRAINIQSFMTPATRIVTVPVLPITKKLRKLKCSMSAQQEHLRKKIQKLNWIWESSVAGFSRIYQGICIWLGIRTFMLVMISITHFFSELIFIFWCFFNVISMLCYEPSQKLYIYVTNKRGKLGLVNRDYTCCIMYISYNSSHVLQSISLLYL